MTDATPTGQQTNRIDEAIADFHRLTDQQERVDRDEFLRQYQDISAELREYFCQLDELEAILGPCMSHSKSPITTTANHPVKAETSLPRGDETQSISGMSSENARFGRYTIERRLGNGGMGVVYLAKDSVLSRRVALKIPHPETIRAAETRTRFLREAQAAAILRHPNICPVYDAGEIHGQPFISMAYVPGESLSAVIARRGAFPISTALRFVGQIAIAMKSAHAAGIVHRDLKPANIMLGEDKQPIIMDFGLATPLDVDSPRLTHSGMIVGTPAYMAPEQALHPNADVTAAADVYSLGVILYELITGHLPFEGNAAQVLGQLVAVDPPCPSQYRPDISEELSHLVLKSLKKTPEDRFADMSEFADAIRVCLNSAPATKEADQRTSKEQLAEQPPPANEFFVVEHSHSTYRRRGRRHHTSLVATGIALCALLALAVILLKTKTGFLQIEYDGDTVEVVILKGKQVHKTLRISRSGRKLVTLEKGLYRLELHGVNAEHTTITPEEIQIASDERTVVVIKELEKNPSRLEGTPQVNAPKENEPSPVTTPTEETATKLTEVNRKQILATVAIVNVAGDKRKPVAVVTEWGACTVLPGGFRDVTFKHTPSGQTSAGFVTSRSPFPFCWIDVDRNTTLKVAKHAAPTQGLSPVYLASHQQGEIVLVEGRITEYGEFAAETRITNGPVFDQKGVCLGFAFSTKASDRRRVYRLKKD